MLTICKKLEDLCNVFLRNGQEMNVINYMVVVNQVNYFIKQIGLSNGVSASIEVNTTAPEYNEIVLAINIDHYMYSIASIKIDNYCVVSKGIDEKEFDIVVRILESRTKNEEIWKLLGSEF